MTRLRLDDKKICRFVQFQKNDRHLFVTPGIGARILPVRFGVPPEISYLCLQSTKGNTR